MQLICYIVLMLIRSQGVYNTLDLAAVIMEEDKRKKKNKKKKNKNNTCTEESQVSNHKNKSELESFEQDVRDIEKKKYNAEAVAEKVSDGKDAVERKDLEITLLQEKLAQYAVTQVSFTLF